VKVLELSPVWEKLPSDDGDNDDEEGIEEGAGAQGIETTASAKNHEKKRQKLETEATNTKRRSNDDEDDGDENDDDEPPLFEPRLDGHFFVRNAAAFNPKGSTHKRA